MASYCSKCGRQLGDGERFCPSCGFDTMSQGNSSNPSGSGYTSNSNEGAHSSGSYEPEKNQQGTYSNTNVKSSPIPTRTYYLGGLLAGILSILLGFVDFWNYSILSGVITIVGGILIIIGAVTIKNGSNVKQAAIFFLIGSILLVASLIGVTLILIPIIGIIGVLLALILLVKK